MKRILSVVTAVALLAGSTTAAMAHGRPGWDRQNHGGYGYSQPYYGGYGYRDYRRHDNTAAAVGFGLLAFGLIATLAAQNNQRNYYGQGYGNAQPYRYSQPYGYNGGYYGGYGY